MKTDTMNIELTKSEGIILFEIIGELNKNKSFKINDSADQNVLWNIEAILEKLLVESFDKNYLEIVEKARLSLRI